MQGGQTNKRNARTALGDINIEVDPRFANEGFLALTSVFFSIVTWSAANRSRAVVDRCRGAEFLVALIDSMLMPLSHAIQISVGPLQKVVIQSGYIDTDWLPNDASTTMLQAAFEAAAKDPEHNVWCQGNLRRCRLSCFLAVMLCNPGDSKSWPLEFQGTLLKDTTAHDAPTCLKFLSRP